MEKKRTPFRRCVACMQSFPQDELVRLTFRDGILKRDGERRNEGRGFYLCKNEACLEKVIKRKVFNRILKTELDATMIKEVIDEIVDTEVVNEKKN